MKLFSLSILLFLLFSGYTALAQKTAVNEQTVVNEAKDKAAKKRAARQAYFAKHPAHYNAEREKEEMDLYEQHAIRNARAVYAKSVRRLALDDEGKCEIHLGYGMISLSDMGGAIFYGEHSKLSSPEPIGTPNIDLKYYISRRFAIGVVGGVEFFKGDITGDESYPGYWAHGKYTGRIVAMAPEATFNLLEKRHVLFYVTMALGYSETEKYFQFNQDNYNASFHNGVSSLPDGESSSSVNGYGGFGMRFGGMIGGFAEFGLGFKGLANCGLSIKL